MRLGIHVIILLGFAVWFAWSEHTNINIIIDKNNGTDSPNCGGSDPTPCKSLNHVMAHRLHSPCNHNNTYISILIKNGSYSYSLNGSDTNYQFRSCDQVDITGEDDVIINCNSSGAGFAFLNCSNVNITDVTFDNCGALQPGTSTTNSSTNETIPVSTALYFAFCVNVAFLRVDVTHSNTSAVVMFNTRFLSVEGSHFRNNSIITNHTYPSSNAAFYVEFCYCDPGVAHDNCTPHDNMGARYIFNLSSFSWNNVLNISNGYNRTFYIPYKNDYFSFGRGGGLSIVFKGNASGNDITVDNCELRNNTALWGGGVFVEFEDESNNNSITFINTDFLLNSVVNDSPTNGTGGGGARVDFLFFNESFDGRHNNKVTFDECRFTDNLANHGGGLSLLSTPEQLVLSSTNILVLKDCVFFSNAASIGAAMDLSTWHSLKKGLPATVKIKDSNFSYNGQMNTDGGVYADCVPAYFYGNILFESNDGSALSVFGTGVQFTDNCQTQFLNNRGWSGGAIALLGNAYIGISPGVNLTFYNNSAFVEGGAIYALLTSRHDILSSRNCFLQYNNQSALPNEWTDVNFIFINNTAPMGHSIYTTSLLPCVWGASYGNINYNLEQVFKWDNFSYTPDDDKQISSGIASLSLNANITKDVYVVPGNFTLLPVNAMDDQNHSTQGSVWLYSYSKQVSVSPNLTGDYKTTPKGHPGDSSQMLIVTDSARNVSLTVNMTLTQCPPGYKWNNGSKVCECGYEDWHGILYCDDVSFTSYLARGYWAGYILPNNKGIANESSLVTAKCPSQYCTKPETSFHRQLPRTANNTIMDQMICSPQNRTGKLCGKCIGDHGVAINVRALQFNCIHCPNTKYSWLKYISSEFIPLTIFFIVILFFDINIHSGVTSSIILYFQVFDALRIVSDDELPPPPNSLGLIRAIQFLYNIWNLQFFGSLLKPYCLTDHLNTMDVLLINYAPGLFPFLLFFVVYLLNNLSCPCCSESERFRQVRYHFRRFWYHLKWHVAVKKSILSGLATVWTLAFTKLALVSFLILSRTSLNADTHVATYQGTLPFLKGRHLQYAIPANIISVCFVYIPATGLLCYPLVPQLMGKLKRWIPLDNYYLYYKITSWLERPFIKLKPIIDCFQGSYKPHHEFFAGLLFWYRLIIFIVFAYSVQSDTYFWNIVVSVAFLVIVGVAQPFKKSRDNIVILLSVANIIMISVLNIYLLDHYHGASKSKYDPHALQWWQLVLVVLPLIFIIVYVIWKVSRKIQAWRKGIPAEGLYVNFSSTYEDPPAEDPLLNFPAQLMDVSENTNYDDDDDDTTQDNSHREARSSTQRNNHTTSRRESSRRLQSDLDGRRSQTYSGASCSSYGAVNSGSDHKQ